MTPQYKVAVTTLTSAAVVVLIVLGVSLQWYVGVTITAVLVCCAVAALVALAVDRHDRQLMEQRNLYVPPPPPPPAAAEPAIYQVVVQEVNLASAWPDYEFLFGATVYWRTVGNPTPTPHVRPGALAVDAIIRRAAKAAEVEQPGMAVRLQHRLDDLLGVVEHDPSGRVEAWADQVRTSLSEADVNRLRTLSDIRKDKAVWEHKRNYECDRREYLTEDVLKSTSSALVWWLSRNESNVTGAVELIGTMARLSAAARDEDVPERFRHLVPASALPDPDAGQPRFATVGSDGAGQPFAVDFALFNGGRSAIDLVTALMGALHLDDGQRALFAARMVREIEAIGDEATAEQVRSRFDVISERTIVDPERPEPESANQAQEHGTPETVVPETQTPED
jgi:hypothetical protein